MSLPYQVLQSSPQDEGHISSDTFVKPYLIQLFVCIWMTLFYFTLRGTYKRLTRTMLVFYPHVPAFPDLLVCTCSGTGRATSVKFQNVIQSALLSRCLPKIRATKSPSPSRNLRSTHCLTPADRLGNLKGCYPLLRPATIHKTAMALSARTPIPLL